MNDFDWEIHKKVITAIFSVVFLAFLLSMVFTYLNLSESEEGIIAYETEDVKIVVKDKTKVDIQVLIDKEKNQVIINRKKN